MLELMGHYRQQPSVQLLWEGIARQVSGCGNGSQCVVEYHAARDRGLGDDAEEVLRSLDVARIVEALREAVGLQPFESPPQRSGE